MDVDERKAIVSVTGLISVFAFIIAVLISPVEIDGEGQADLNTRFTTTGGEVYTGIFAPLFDRQSKITLADNASVSIGINKANFSFHIKTPMFGLWLFKDEIKYILNE